MAANTYAAYASQSTAATRLTYLRAHIAELEAINSNFDVQADGKSTDRTALEAKLRRLHELLPRYELASARESGTLTQRIVFAEPS